MDISPDLVAQHAKAAAWVIGALGTVILSIAGVVMRKVVKAIKEAAQDLKFLRDIQGVQAENHLTHIQDATAITRDETIKTNAKLDVLISVIEKKL